MKAVLTAAPRPRCNVPDTNSEGTTMTSGPDDELAGADDAYPEPPVFDPITRMLGEIIARVDRNLAYADGLLQKIAESRPPE